MLVTDENQCDLLKTFGDETRLRLIRLLDREELNVQELCTILELPQPKVSRHLAILRQSDLVEDRRHGNRIFYSLSQLKSEFSHFSGLLANVISTDHPDLERLETCINSRNSSKTLNASEWDEELKKLYNPLTALPALANLAPRGLVVADFGTGTGRMLPVLSQFADTVYAIDYSQTMLDFAEKRAKALGLDNIKFIKADLLDRNFILPPCDGILMHFMIHQADEPGEVIKRVSEFLKPSGRLVVIDRSTHTDESVRKNFGSKWLGFDQEQLREWFVDAGLEKMDWNTNPDLTNPVPVFTASAQRI
ncbi:MAG: metalloregulator ArsR/SmtB family transcription factor [Lentisphaeria bacterium]|nr:metalloregulator ArsR/SmtB family transcription factor [Lentisphaeria bacterium]